MQIFIMTRNRVKFLQQCIDSCQLHGVEVVISDNSTCSVSDQIEVPDSFEYRYRGGRLSGIEHFNLCISESIGDHVMVFHDDDMMISSEMQNYITWALAQTSVAAVAGLVYYINIKDH